MKISKKKLEDLISEAVEQKLDESIWAGDVHEPKGFRKLQTKHSFSVALPRAVAVDDYHELTAMPGDLSELLGIRVKVEEIGVVSGAYVGIMYVKKDKAYQILKAHIEKEVEQDYAEL